ncbi:hypothetical protein HOY80DRAFT_450461 [Tuber brumale]|nr:hypothetical protein HOY80DRAFT_450461 [Tuber brumale]
MFILPSLPPSVLSFWYIIHSASLFYSISFLLTWETSSSDGFHDGGCTLEFVVFILFYSFSSSRAFVSFIFPFPLFHFSFLRMIMWCSGARVIFYEIRCLGGRFGILFLLIILSTQSLYSGVCMV